MSWSEVCSSGSECSASGAGSMVCFRAGHHKYLVLFCGYEMVEDHNSDSLKREL